MKDWHSINMRRKKVFIAIVILLVLGLGVFAEYQRRTRDIEFEVPGRVSAFRSPSSHAISNQFVLYHDPYNGLIIYDIHKRTRSAIETGFRTKTSSICAPWVVWLVPKPEQYFMAGYDLRNGQNISIDLDNIGKPRNPQVDGNTLFWVDGFNLNGYDLQTQSKFVACADMLSPGDPNVSNLGIGDTVTLHPIPDIDGDTVAWKGLRDTDGIQVLDLKTHRRFSIPSRPSSLNPKVSGQYIVWIEMGQFAPKKTPDLIVAYNLFSGDMITIDSGMRGIWGFDLSGDIVVWDTDMGSITNSDIYGCNLSSRKVFPICTAEGNQYAPRISGDTVIWCDDRPQGWLSKILEKEPCQIRGKIFRHWPGEE
jgi:beta propeller repeat protein